MSQENSEKPNLFSVGNLFTKKIENDRNTEDLSKRERPKKDKYIIIHYSDFKTRWDWAVLTLTYYTSVMVPLVAAFNVTGRSNLWLVIDSMVDVFFFADVIINFRTTYAGEEGEIVADLRLIRIKYLKTWFFADIMTCVPYDAITLLIGDLENYAKLLGIMKSLRLLRLFRIARDLDRYLAHAYASLIVLMSLILLLCHWMGCGWYNIALLDAATHVESAYDLEASLSVPTTRLPEPMEKNFIRPFELMKGSNDIFFGSKILPGNYPGHQRREITENVTVVKKEKKQERVRIFPKNWLVRLGERTGSVFYWDGEKGQLKGGPSVEKTYCACLYFTMTAVISQGFGNFSGETYNEQIYCIFILLFGCLLYAAILGNVTTAIESISARKEQFTEIIDSIKKFSKIYSIPKRLVDSMFDYVYFTWTATHGISEKKVMDCLPEHMRLDAGVYLHRHVLTTQTAFKGLSETSSRHLASQMERYHIAPGDLLVDRGEIIELMYFVISGSLEVVLHGQVVGILSSEDSFGTEFWSSVSKRNGAITSEFAVVALTYVDLEIVPGSEVIKAMKVYPDIQKAFFRSFKLTFNLAKQMDFQTVAAVHWKKEVDEDPEAAEKDKRLKSWMTKTKEKRTKENIREAKQRQNASTIELKASIVKVHQKSSNVLRKIKKVINAQKLIMANDGKTVATAPLPEDVTPEKPDDTQTDACPTGILRKTGVGIPKLRGRVRISECTPKRYRRRREDIVQLIPLDPRGDYFQRLDDDNEISDENLPANPEEIITRASVCEISYDENGRKTVRQLPDLKFSLDKGDWIDSELPIEIKEILQSIQQMKIEGKSQLNAVRKRLDVCEKSILNIADLVQQMYG